MDTYTQPTADVSGVLVVAVLTVIDVIADQQVTDTLAGLLAATELTFATVAT